MENTRPVAAIRALPVIAFLLVCAPSSATAQAPGDAAVAIEDGPVEVVDALWRVFDRSYALFEDKRVPWSAVREAYRTKARRTRTEGELFDVATEMLSLLDDNHVKLTGWTGIMSAAGDLRGAGPPEDFSPDLVRESYLVSPVEERLGGRISFGWLTDSVGYVHASAMYDSTASGQALDEALETFASARGLVLDLRRNLGGEHTVGQALASRFADRPRHYATTRLKSGPGRDDFTAPRQWILSPPPGGGYTRPVVVLVHGFTFSAGETPVLALRALPQVIVVGTETSGSMGETENGVLPNGWVYRTVGERILDAEGRSWEGVGIPPDLRVVNDPGEMRNGRDRALEAAIDLIASGGLAVNHRDESLDEASLVFRLPLADSLVGWIEQRGWRSAMGRFREARPDSARWFLAEDWEYGDLTTLGLRLLDDGRTDAAVAVLEAATSAYPGSYRPYLGLTRAYQRLGRRKEAEAARGRALDLNPEMSRADLRAAIELRARIPLSYIFFERLFGGDEAAEGGPEAAIREYRDLADRHPDRVEVDPLILVRGAQQLREAGQSDAARKVFGFVAEEFPEWPIGHLGLAVVSSASGDLSTARRAYRRVLELDPRNRAAREGLARIEESGRQESTQ